MDSEISKIKAILSGSLIIGLMTTTFIYYGYVNDHYQRCIPGQNHMIEKFVEEKNECRNWFYKGREYWACEPTYYYSLENGDAYSSQNNLTLGSPVCLAHRCDHWLCRFIHNGIAPDTWYPIQ